MSKAAEKAKRLGFKGVNKPKLTRSHATKKAAVVSTLGPGQEDGVLIRFGDQKMGNNYSAKARTAFKKRHAKNIARNALSQLGIEIENVESNVGVLSGGERQSISIARAVYFQSKLLILDEPTAALSLKETAKVLSYVQEAKKSNVGVIMITHNISHAWESADRFVVLYRGEVASILKKEETSVKEIENLINTGKR